MSERRFAPGRERLHVVTIAAGLALGLGVLGVIWLFAEAIALLVLAVTLASALAPVVCWLEKRMSRPYAILSLYVALFGILVVVGALVMPQLTAEVGAFAKQLPQITDRVRDLFGTRIPIDGDTLSASLQQALPRLLSLSSSVATAAVDILIVAFLSLYLLIAAPDFHTAVTRLLPPRQRRRVSRILGQIASEMGGYFRGAAINGVIVATLSWGALVVNGVEYALPLGSLAFFGELVPYIGPIAAALPAIAVALTHSTTTALAVTASYVAIQQIEGHVLTPTIMHTQTHLSQAVVIIALTMGYTAGGVLGALSSIPMFAAARVIVVHLIAPMLRRNLRSVST